MFVLEIFISCLILTSTPTLAAYSVVLNGQPLEIELIDIENGGFFEDRSQWRDDYGNKLPIIDQAVCSSLTEEYCPEISKVAVTSTIHPKNHFPSYESEFSANKKYDPYTMKQSVLSTQLDALLTDAYHSFSNRATQLFSLDDFLLLTDNFKHMSTKKYSFERKNGKLSLAESPSISASSVDTHEDPASKTEPQMVEVEVELFGQDMDGELMDALGVDQDELTETIDKMVAQLLSSYIENDEEVDVAQVYIQGLSANSDGDVNFEDFGLDEQDVDEMNTMLAAVKAKYKTKEKNDLEREDDEEEHIGSKDPNPMNE